MTTDITTDAIMIDIVEMSSDAIAERIIADEMISGGKITKVVTPTMLLTLKATTHF